jgi:hypothetical protein
MLDSEIAANRGFPGLNGWMKQAESLWNENKRSEMSLKEMFDYFGQLSAQFPPRELRVVYAKAGISPAACVVRDSKQIVENRLYWGTVETEDEARYLEAILNSETARARAAVYQSRGQWGARDFDKVMFNLPIPRFDEKQKLHRDLAAAAAEAETIAASVGLPEKVKFQQARKLIREALASAGVSQRIDSLVAKLLDRAEPNG